MSYRVDRYVLNEKGEPVKEPDLFEWAHWMQVGAWKVAQETVGKKWVSTIFLGLDHNYGAGPPILWETMVFSKRGAGRKALETIRCSGSREQAEAQHIAAVAKLRQRGRVRC